MGNPFCHVELHANGAPEAKKFYGEFLDWSFDDMQTPVGPYTMIGVGDGDGVGGGIRANPAAGTPSHWLAYIQVEDVAAAAKRPRTDSFTRKNLSDFRPAGPLDLFSHRASFATVRQR